MRHTIHDGILTLYLEGRIDANGAPQVEDDINALMDELSPVQAQLDGSSLAYLSSAGLRIVMRLLKRCRDVRFVNATPEVYDVLEMTGLTEILPVTKQLRNQSLSGLKHIGAGAFGRVYRLDAERVIKVYAPEVNPLDKIERERTSARQAFIHGIPSAIPFEVVRVGKEHGIIYELVDARTLGEAVTLEPDRLDEYAMRMADLLKQLHGTHFDQGQLPDARDIFRGWVDVAERSGLYAPRTIKLLRQFVDDFGAADTFVHGDFHPANIMVMPDDELLLIDMGDASMGSPDIDLAGMFHVLRIAARRPGGAERLTGMSQEALDRLWDTFVRHYYDVESKDEVTAIEHRLKTLALPRTMGSTARSKLIDDETRRRQACELEREFLATYNT
jgi:uncharacterized protein (TIGR02172 family)